MKKVIMLISIVILIVLIFVMFFFMNDKEDKKETTQKSHEDNTTQNTQTNNEKEPQTTSQNKDSSTNLARDNAEKYVEMAYNYDLTTEYKQNKDMFSDSMYKQLDKYGKDSKGSSYGKNKDISREVSDIKIYFEDEKEFPEKAIYKAKVTADNKKEKNKMIRTVTGEINFTEEKGKPKIDSSEETDSEETEE